MNEMKPSDCLVVDLSCMWSRKASFFSSSISLLAVGSSCLSPSRTEVLYFSLLCFSPSFLLNNSFKNFFVLTSNKMSTMCVYGLINWT